MQEIADIIDGDRGKNYPQQHEFFDEGYCLFLNTGNVTKEGFSFSENQYISKEKCDSLRKGKLQRHDIVYTTRGTVGNAAYYGDGVPYEHIRINSGMIIIRPKEEIVCTKFLYQILKSNYYRPYFKQYCTGSAQPQLPIKNFSQIEIDLPELETQQKIAAILSAYDDLIENNRKQIKLLEEAAGRLYREWFVELRFPGHETTPVTDGVPEGWKSLPLKDLIETEIGGGWGKDFYQGKFESPAYVIRGTDIPEILHGNIKNIPYRYHAKNNLMSRELCDGDIIFEVSGGSKTEGVARSLLIRSALLETYKSPVMCASFCKRIHFKDVEISQYMYDVFQYLRASGKTAEFDKKSASSIVNYRWQDFLSQQMVVMPSREVLVKYNRVAESVYNKMIILSKLAEKAAEARDRLLPKLMSGEIEV